MEDTFVHDLRQEPELLEEERFATTEGGLYWPHLVFARPDGFRPLILDLRTPPGTGPHPLLVYIHGGGWVIGTPKYGNPTLRGIGMVPRLIEAGWAVARISYRLAGEAHWPAQLHDCKAAIRWLRTRAGAFNLDPARFAVLGESAGGQLAAMVGLTSGQPEREGDVGAPEGSSAVQAAVNWYGVTDFAAMPAPAADETGPGVAELLAGRRGAEAAEPLRDASPLTHVRTDAPPFLHQHGDNDRVVPLAQAEALHAALLAAGAESELHVIPGADHCFWGAVSPAVMDRVLQFLEARVTA